MSAGDQNAQKITTMIALRPELYTSKIVKSRDILAASKMFFRAAIERNHGGLHAQPKPGVLIGPFLIISPEGAKAIAAVTLAPPVPFVVSDMRRQSADSRVPASSSLGGASFSSRRNCESEPANDEHWQREGLN